MGGTRIESFRTGDCAVITLSSPDGLNRLGAWVLESLRSEVERALEGNCRCLGITGKGKSFAVGADLRELAALSPKAARALSDLANGVIRLLENSGVPVVAGIDGFCLGGAVDLVLGADWRLASSTSVFGHPGADLGIITGFGGTQRLSRLIGQRCASQWILTAARVGAVQAYEAGFLQEVCEPDGFRSAFEKRMKAFASLPREWVGEVKKSLRLNF